MKEPTSRRAFMRFAGVSIGASALYQVGPLARLARAEEISRSLRKANSEAVTPFTFVQLSDTHVGFSGPPDPLGSKAFERAVEMVNALPNQPELIIFSGDLTHDADDPKDPRQADGAVQDEFSGTVGIQQMLKKGVV